MNKGIVLVDKEVNYTSRDIVNILCKVFNNKKIGHTGTLDPIASGVLVVLVGKYTKLGNVLTALDKEYIAEIKLGIKTDTLDITGEVLEKKDFLVDKEKVREVLESFLGEYHMEVPLYSAIKVDGKRLYQYAREKKKVELPIKNVRIEEIELLSLKGDIIRFRVKVEKGTYIRSLIRDICEKLGTVGTMNSLVRIRQGNFRLEDAYTLEDIKKGNYKVLSIKDILKVREYEIRDDEFGKKVFNGNKIDRDFLEDLILFTYKGEEVALYQKNNDEYKPFIMLK